MKQTSRMENSWSQEGNKILLNGGTRSGKGKTGREVAMWYYEGMSWRGQSSSKLRGHENVP